MPSRVREAELREAQEAATLLELLPVSARAAATEERPAAASAARQQAEAAEAAGAGRAAAAAAIPVFVVAIEAAAKSVPLGVGQLLQGMIVKSELVVSTRGHCMHRSIRMSDEISNSFQVSFSELKRKEEEKRRRRAQV